jgi:hypothetical protein
LTNLEADASRSSKMQIIVDRIPHNGHIVLKTFYGDKLFTRVYIGYTLKEAKRKFQDDFDNEFLTQIF